MNMAPEIFQIAEDSEAKKKKAQGETGPTNQSGSGKNRAEESGDNWGSLEARKAQFAAMAKVRPCVQKPRETADGGMVRG